MCLLLHVKADGSRHCVEGGELHFLQIGGVCDDIDDGDIFVDGPLSKGVEQLLEGTKPSSNPSSPGITGRRDVELSSNHHLSTTPSVTIHIFYLLFTSLLLHLPSPL